MMGRALSYLVISCLFWSQLSASANLSSSEKKWTEQILSLDAEYSHDRDQLFRSYRLLEWLRENKKESFFSGRSLELQLRNLSLLASEKSLGRYCEQIYKEHQTQRDRIAYHCAKIFYEQQILQQAHQWLLKIDKNAGQIQSQILLASIYLGLNQPDLCLQSLAVELASAHDFEDIERMTRARCFVASHQYEKAIVELNQLRADSSYYVQSLVDLSWAYFKNRQIGDARNSIDIVLSSYDPNQHKAVDLSEPEYLQLRYLKAYLGLVQSGASKVNEEMILVDKDLQWRRQKQQKSSREFAQQAEKYLDGQLTKEEQQNLIGFLQNWSLPRAYREAVREARYYRALRAELQEKLPEAYRKKITELEQRLRPRALQVLASSYSSALAAMEGFSFRLQLARLKADGLTESKGLQSLKQATEVYQRKERYLQGQLGELQ